MCLVNKNVCYEIHVQVCIHTVVTCNDMHIHVYSSVCMSVWVSVCVHVCVYVSVCVHVVMCVQYVCVCVCPLCMSMYANLL